MAYFYIKNNELWARGDNGSGQLGLGEIKHFEDFTKVPLDFLVNSVYNFGEYTMLINKYGQVYLCGKNEIISSDKSVFNRFTLLEDVESVTDIVSNGYSTIFVCYDGTIYECERFGPKFVHLKFDYKIIKASCDYYHAVLLDDVGNIYLKGNNKHGQLGISSDINKLSDFQIHNLGTKIVDIACGFLHTMLVDKQGYIWCAGSNDRGQLGCGPSNNMDFKNVPVFQQIITGPRAKTISCCDDYTMVIDQNGDVWATGSNRHNRIIPTGGLTGFLARFCKIQVPSNSIVSINCLHEHIMFLDNHGYVWVTMSPSELQRLKIFDAKNMFDHSNKLTEEVIDIMANQRNQQSQIYGRIKPATA